MIDHNPFPMPSSDDKPCEEHVLAWTWEREAIRIAKENGYTGELTQDPILKKYRFCNIRRRDDRVSKWIIENILDPCAGEEDIWFVAAIARYVNWPPSLQELINADAIPEKAEDFDYKLFATVMDGITQRGEKSWGGAYVLYPGHREPGTLKGYRVGKHILKPLIDYKEEILSAIHDMNSIAATVEAISKSYGFSTFIGGQIAADLTYVPALKNADDIYDFAPKGPGSQSGLNFLYGYSPQHEWCQSHFNEALIKIRRRIIYELNIDDMTLHDCQNVMCEMWKYYKELYGIGHPKTIYRPETRF